MNVPFPTDCTKCGRSIRNGETAHVTWYSKDSSVEVQVLCALHTDEEIPGSWHDDAEAARD